MNKNPWSIGDRVTIADGSIAQGDGGEIFSIGGDNLILVQLDQDCVWPVSPDQIKRRPGRRPKATVEYVAG